MQNGEDKNYESDFTKIGTFYSAALDTGSGDYLLEFGPGNAYWFASRAPYPLGVSNYFAIRVLNYRCRMISSDLFSVGKDNLVNVKTNEVGLAICISIKPTLEITGGDGTTESTAYTLGT